MWMLWASQGLPPTATFEVIGHDLQQVPAERVLVGGVATSGRAHARDLSKLHNAVSLSWCLASRLYGASNSPLGVSGSLSFCLSPSIGLFLRSSSRLPVRLSDGVFVCVALLRFVCLRVQWCVFVCVLLFVRVFVLCCCVSFRVAFFCLFCFVLLCVCLIVGWFEHACCLHRLHVASSFFHGVSLFTRFGLTFARNSPGSNRWPIGPT
jgi:hypothetical protein